MLQAIVYIDYNLGYTAIQPMPGGDCCRVWGPGAQFVRRLLLTVECHDRQMDVSP
jgi:hypothetical protein